MAKWLINTNSKEVSTNNRRKFIASFIVFLVFCPNKLQRLFSDNSQQGAATMKKASIEKIWCEFLETQDSVDCFDCNSDVIFELNDGSKWVATFFTYQNIETLRKKNQLSGECLNGIYFCATDMILVAEISEEIIKSVLQELLSMDEIDTYCRKLST